MIKVKKQGKLQWHRFYCESCGCRFEATTPEVFLVCGVDGPAHFCDCPCCGQECGEEHEEYA